MIASCMMVGIGLQQSFFLSNRKSWWQCAGV